MHRHQLQRLPSRERAKQPSKPLFRGSQPFEATQVGLEPSSRGWEAPPVVLDSLRSAGQPLEASARTQFESRFGHDFSQVRVHTDSRAREAAESIHARAFTVGNDIVFRDGAAATDRRLLAHELTHTLQQTTNPALQRAQVAADPGVAKPRYTQADKSTVCPTCLCSAPEASRIDEFRAMAAQTFTDAASQLGNRQEEVVELFEGSFGRGSATEENINHILETLRGAAIYLNVAAANEIIHCDSTSSSAGCSGGKNDAFHQSGHIVLCSERPVMGKALQPPEVKPVTKTVLNQSGTTEQGGQSSKVETTEKIDQDATDELQEKSNQGYDAKLVSILAHEAIHYKLKSSVIDVYRGERLYGFLGSRSKSPVDLSPIALHNPDSIVAFAMLSLSFSSAGKELLPRPETALETSEVLSGELSVRPILGRRNARLAMALVQEAIEQAGKSIGTLSDGVTSAQGKTTSWDDFFPPPGEVLSLLRDLDVEKTGQKRTAYDNAGAPAKQRLAEILAGLMGLRTELLQQRTVLGRRFVFDRKERVEVAIPEWRKFRDLPIDQQVLRLLEVLVKRDPRISRLATFIFEHARRLGGLGQVGQTAITEK